MGKVILLNAPPNAGKDVVAEEFRRVLGVAHRQFKGKLFEIAKVISGLTDEEWDAIYTRELKEVPDERLWGLSPREFLIDISERMIKPLAGKDYFGEILGKECSYRLADGLDVVVSDSGFNEEAEALCRIVGAENVYCVRFLREGCSFDGDSRNYVDTPMITNYIDLINDGTIEDLCQDIYSFVKGG